MGSLVTLAVTAFQLRSQQTLSFDYLLAAIILYIVGVFGVTMFANVPLNNRLANFNILSATQNDLANMRFIFEKPWITFHFIRTIASIASFVLCIISLIKLK